jgi:gamma-D-glutamyl-L-lysine dipeptidyl-peptidase
VKSADMGSAVVRAAVAPLQGEPRVSSAQVSQALAGHPLDLLEQSEEWCRVRTPDGYEGWVHEGYLVRLPPTPSAVAQARRDFTSLISLGCVAVDGDDRRRALPLGALLARHERPVSGHAVPLDELPQLFPRTCDALCLSATRLFDGTSYEWGGITPWGADCSGFTQAIFGLHGIQLPRDAWQQALVGNDARSDLASCQSADLVFFSDRADRRITHVGIALGHGRMAHVALGRGGFAIDNLADPSDSYVAKLRQRFVGARRLELTVTSND